MFDKLVAYRLFKGSKTENIALLSRLTPLRRIEYVVMLVVLRYRASIVFDKVLNSVAAMVKWMISGVVMPNPLVQCKCR